MQLTNIRYVIAIAKEGSFTKAAESLYISQPALSQAIRRLEQEMKISIFIREKNKVSLTPAGEVLVGGASSYVRYFFSRVLAEFQTQHPHAQLILQDGFTQNLCADLLEGNLDIGLLAEPIPEGIDHYPVFQEEIFLALPWNHPLNRKFPPKGKPYPVADLSLCRDEKFISCQPYRRITDILFTEARRADFTPNILLESSSTENANAMICHGMGIGLIPEVTVRLCPKEQRARYYRLRPGGLIRRFHIGRRAGKFNNRLQEKFFSMAKAFEIT